MKYKSILLDVDGTLVPVGPNTTPSQKVIDTLRRAKDLVDISIVSGRPINWLGDIFNSLNLTSPCIVNGGSQIIDPKTKAIMWERPMAKQDVETILETARKNNVPFMINDDGVEHRNPSTSEFAKPLAMQLTHFESKAASDQMMRVLDSLSGITAHKFFSWDKNRDYQMEVYITHKNASKRHAVEELAKILDIDTHEMIGVGDARNDIPLLGVCGLRVAMGNADKKLKACADYIAPSVDEDGVADVVEKFILDKKENGSLLPSTRNAFPDFFNKFVNFFRHH